MADKYNYEEVVLKLERLTKSGKVIWIQASKNTYSYLRGDMIFEISRINAPITSGIYYRLQILDGQEKIINLESDLNPLWTATFGSKATSSLNSENTSLKIDLERLFLFIEEYTQEKVLSRINDVLDKLDE